MKVLVWPSSCGAGQEACRALSYQRDVVVVRAAVDEGIHVPPVTVEGWWPVLRDAMLSCDVLLPVQDDAILALTVYDTLPFRVALPSVRTTSICLSKSRTYNALRDTVRVPRTVDLFPCYVKPDFGYGARVGGVARDRVELLRRIAECQPHDAHALELIEGPEHTVECFSERGRYRWHMCRTRERVRASVSMLTRRIEQPWAAEWAAKISEALQMHGAWYFQTKGDPPVLMEVSPRLTSCGLARANGVNLALLTCYAVFGDAELTIVDQRCVTQCERSVVCSYIPPRFDTLYVDLDDTLVTRGRVNWQLQALCMKYMDAGCKVIVLTRNMATADILQSLPTMTKAIVMTQPSRKKSAYVRRNDILIDDSFAERSEVHGTTGALCYDVATALEVLR